jgi:SAM-dependent methyltransferase
MAEKHEKYNWRQYTNTSDKRYKDARVDGDLSPLKSHNILSSGEIELRFIDDVLRAYRGKPVTGKWALDVCCGSGYMTGCLIKKGLKAVGFDLNEDAIELGKSTVRDAYFFVSDAANPSKQVKEKKYDLILIREAHPFSRIDDFDFQADLTGQYLSLLNTGGTLVIAHARRGGGMSYPSVSFDRLQNWAEERGYMAAGPFYMFLYKHLGLKSPGKTTLKMQSFLSSFLAGLFRQRWIEFFFITDTEDR